MVMLWHKKKVSVAVGDVVAQKKSVCSCVVAQKKVSVVVAVAVAAAVVLLMMMTMLC